MKGLPILAAALGVAAIAALIGYFGAGAVVRSLLAVGGLGFAVICAIHLALVAVMGFAWGGLIPGAPAWTAIWGRLVRDSGSELLPFWQVGGYVLGARALALTGIPGTIAAASTIVRSEERRVGKEWEWRWWRYQCTQQHGGDDER